MTGSLFLCYDGLMSKFKYLKLNTMGKTLLSLKDVKRAGYPKLSVYWYSDSFGNLERTKMIAVHSYPLPNLYCNEEYYVDLVELMREVNLFNEDAEYSWVDLLEERDTAILELEERVLVRTKENIKALKKRLKKIKEMKNDRTSASNS